MCIGYGGKVWYGMVWYGMVWYGMVWYGMVWYGTVWYRMVWVCNTRLRADETSAELVCRVLVEKKTYSIVRECIAGRYSDGYGRWSE